VASACGAEVIVDPTGSLTDPNGDALAIVPGSVVAPAGVTTQVRADGTIAITAPAGVSSTYTLTWIVTDGRGGTAPVTFTLTTTCFTPNQGAQCVSRLPILTWSLTSPAGPVEGPVTIYWYDDTGTYRTATEGLPVQGFARFPAEPWAGRSVEVTFGTPDGALVGPFDVPNLCATLPATGTDPREVVTLGALLLAAGAALLGPARRRRVARRANA
jgi:LPXTG-motif cell wall-anchored protein